MRADHPIAFGRRLDATTRRYLGRLSDCVGALPVLLGRYGEGRACRPVLARIRGVESDCDGSKLELGRLLTDAARRDTGAVAEWDHRHTGRMLELYERLDTIANATEQFAGELLAIAPTRRGDCLGGLSRMAEIAVAAMDELERVVGGFVEALIRPDNGVSITEGVSTIRALEGEADTVRNGVIEAAFDREGDGSAVAYRQLAVLLDGVLDAMEDVTDRMHLTTGVEGWPEIEIYPDCGSRPLRRDTFPS